MGIASRRAGGSAAFLMTTVWLGSCGPVDDDSTGPAAATQALEPFVTLEGTLDIAGGTAHIPVMEEARQRIMRVNPRIRITVAGGGSGQGVQQVTQGLVDIGNTGRALSDEEIQAGGLTTIPFALDGVAVVTHPENSVQALSSQQVRDLFAGRITSWKDLGGADREVHLFTREEGSGTRKTFWSRALGKGDIASHANVVASNGAMKTAIGNDPGSLGYLSIGHIDDSVVPVALDGVEPTQNNARTGSYAVTRKLYMNTKGEPTGLTRAFIDYILGVEGAAIVADCRYIPLSG